MDSCSSMVLRMFQVSTCFPMVFSTGCTGISAPVCGAPHLSPSLTLVSAGMFLTHFFPLHSAAQCFLPFRKFDLSEVLPWWLLGSAVSYSGTIGAVWNELCPAQGDPGLSSQRPLLQPLLSKTLPHKQNISIMTSLTTFFNKYRRHRGCIYCCVMAA